MNNKQYFKFFFSMLDDTRMDILGDEFGRNEAIGIWTNLLKILYKDYEKGIPMTDRVLEKSAEKCNISRQGFDKFVEMCISEEVAWLTVVEFDGVPRLLSYGVAKEAFELEKNKENGAKPPKEGSRPRGRPSKNLSEKGGGFLGG